MNTFEVQPKIYFGVGALERLSELKVTKAFIVTDPFMIKSGFIKKVTEQLEKGNIDYDVFSDIVPDPPIETVVKGMKAMDMSSPDALITLGGGSAIDAAKAICHFKGLVKKGINPESHEKKPLFIAIPTTSGTGSEVTSFSVITDKKANVKYPLVDKELTPDEAILDPELVKSVPKSITADTGLDVLTHAIEAYVSSDASDYSDALAEKAIKLVFKYLPRACNDGNDIEAREKMHNASCIAGLAFTNASLGINHSMAHILGGKFHIPHGRANAILMPYVIEYNADIRSSFKQEYSRAALKYGEIAEFLGLSCSNTRNAVKSLTNSIRNLIKNLELPKNIKEVGINEEEFKNEIKDMARIALEDGCTKTNPRVPTLEELEELFCKVYYGA